MTSLTVRETKQVKDLIDFCNGLVIKDEDAADEAETKESSIQSHKFLAAFLGTDSLIDYAEGANTNLETEEERDKLLAKLRENLINNYKEINPYYLDLKERYGISYTSARLAKDYDLLWRPRGYLSAADSDIFLELYFASKKYYINVVYNQAFQSYELYRNFNNFFIVFMTMERFLTSQMQYIHNYDLFDEWSLRNMFISYDLDYFYDLPVNYQRRLLKNLNSLIKNKGTNQAIIDIVQLFGFENVNIYKHFLAKQYNNGLLETPDLAFYKLDYKSTNIQRDLKRNEAEDYDTFIEGDPYWQAEKEDILKEQFNMINTKYFSIDADLHLVRNSLNTAYLLNMIRDMEYLYPTNNFSFANSQMSSKAISYFDAIIGINILALDYLGYEDNVITTPENVNRVYGYNYTKEFMYASIIKGNQVLDRPLPQSDMDANEFARVFTNNWQLRESIEKQMYVTNDYKTVKQLRNLMTVQFTSQRNTEIYKGFNTYSEYIKSSNPEFLDYINMQIATDSRKGLLEIATALEQSIQIPAVGALLQLPPILEYMEEFLRLLISIFKSYTTELKDFNIKYIIDDKINDRIHHLEDVYFSVELGSGDFYETLLVKDWETVTSEYVKMEVHPVKDFSSEWLWFNAYDDAGSYLTDLFLLETQFEFGETVLYKDMEFKSIEDIQRFKLYFYEKKFHTSIIMRWEELTIRERLVAMTIFDEHYNYLNISDLSINESQLFRSTLLNLPEDKDLISSIINKIEGSNIKDRFLMHETNIETTIVNLIKDKIVSKSEYLKSLIIKFDDSKLFSATVLKNNTLNHRAIFSFDSAREVQETLFLNDRNLMDNSMIKRHKNHISDLVLIKVIET